MVISSLEGSAAYVMSFEGVRRAVLEALKLGLSSLLYLRGPHILGDFRVSALKSMADRGDTLQLVFPQQDMHFVYGNSLGVADDPEQREVLVGKRLKHVWLNAAVGDKVYSMSSVDVGPFFCITNLHAKVVLLLMVPYDAANLWREAVRKGGGGLCIRVIGIRPRSSSEATHDMLQKSFQTPYYKPQLTDTAGPSMNGTDTRQLPTSDAFDDVTELQDVTGEWFLSAVSKEGVPLAVFVRPDGHVADLADSSRPSEHQVLAALNQLHLNHAPQSQ
jgi:hypothetical protein